MLFDFDDRYQVSWLDIGNAVTLAMQRELFAIWRSLINFDLQRLTLPLDLLSLADFASLGHID
jgi:hypothetical protein